MKTRFPYRRKIDYQNSAEDRRLLSMYLQAGRFRKNSGIRDLEYPIKKRRVFLYCIAGILFCTGMFFVFF